jgi:outer membrane protein assembly factor BamA
VLENEGWLTKDLFEENKYINYVGHIYKREEVVEKRWRNFKYWAPYSNQQMEALAKLVKKLCEEYKIPLNVVAHNTGFKDANKYEGILYRSNFEKHYTDISPTWDSNMFKVMIENK